MDRQEQPQQSDCHLEPPTYVRAQNPDYRSIYAHEVHCSAKYIKRVMFSSLEFDLPCDEIVEAITRKEELPSSLDDFSIAFAHRASEQRLAKVDAWKALANGQMRLLDDPATLNSMIEAFKKMTQLESVETSGFDAIGAKEVINSFGTLHGDEIDYDAKRALPLFV